MIFIIGPTNCGKTDLSIKLSKHFNSGYISALTGIRSLFKDLSESELTSKTIELLKKDHLFVIKDVLHQLNETRQVYDVIRKSRIGFENSIITDIINPLDFCRLVDPAKDIIIFIYSQYLTEFEKLGLIAIEKILQFWIETKLVNDNQIIIHNLEKDNEDWDYLFDKILIAKSNLDKLLGNKI